MRNKLIEILESAESAFYWDSSDKSFINKIADHIMGSGFITELQNEAFDLGVDVVLHDKLGLSWDDAGDLRKEIKRLQGEKRWIPVEERLPERDCRVAVLYRFPRSDMKFSTVFDYYASDPVPHFQHTMGEGGPIVTHWMPLPELPKEEV